MRRMMLFGLAALALGLLSTSCSDPMAAVAVEQQEPETEKTMVFQATMAQFEDEAGTKTALDPLKAVRWSEGDEIMVFNTLTPAGEKFTLKAGDGGKIVGSFDGPDIGAGPYYAVYPASAVEGVATPFTTSPLAINAVIAPYQDYAAGSFGLEANLSVATGNDVNNLLFHNVLGAVKFTLKGTTTIVAINLCTRGNESLNGDVLIDNLEGTPTAHVTGLPTEYYQVKSLNCTPGIALNEETGVDFYISVPPGTLEDGFFVEFYDNEGRAMIKTAKGSGANTIKRSGIRSMPAFSFAAQYSRNFLVEHNAFGGFIQASAGGAEPVKYQNQHSQHAYLITDGDPGSYYVRFQDRGDEYTEGYALSLDIASKDLTLNSTPNVAVKAMGVTGEIVTHDASPMKVIKRTAKRAWLYDADRDQGFVILVEE